MKSEAEQALRDSIKKYKKLSKFTKRKQVDKSETTSNDCSLCNIFRRNNEKSCEHAEYGLCPVRKATGLRYCEGSPYHRMHAAGNNVVLAIGKAEVKVCMRAWREACSDEAEFLKSLLEDS